MNTDGQNKKSFCQKIEPWIVKNEFNLDRSKNIFCLNGDCAFAATMLFNANENWIVIRGTFEYKKADNNCYAKAAMKKQWQTWQSPIFSQFINGRLTWKFSPQASNPTLMCERGPAEKI